MRVRFLLGDIMINFRVFNTDSKHNYFHIRNRNIQLLFMLNRADRIRFLRFVQKLKLGGIGY